MDLNETAVFVKVVQAGSFSAAARQLGLPISTVSTRVARLERRLGVTLLQRTTRRLHLTELGARYYDDAAVGLGQLLEAEAAVTASAGAPAGRLRVTAPADFGDALLVGLLTRLRAAYPLIDVELLLTDSYVDLVAEGVDVAIRAGDLRDSSLVAKRVGVACWALFSSPVYLDGAPPLASPRDLRGHHCLQFAQMGKTEWTLSNGKQSARVPLKGTLIANHLGVIRLLALGAQGVGVLPTYICGADLQAGRLVRVLPTWRARARNNRGQTPVFLLRPLLPRPSWLSWGDAPLHHPGDLCSEPLVTEYVATVRGGANLVDQRRLHGIIGDRPRFPPTAHP